MLSNRKSVCYSQSAVIGIASQLMEKPFQFLGICLACGMDAGIDQRVYVAAFQQRIPE